jgi:hypothetical protein
MSMEDASVGAPTAAVRTSAFERDRRRLTFLCEEMLRRLSEGTGQQQLSAIVQISKEIEETDLAVKLGFVGRPVFLVERSHGSSEHAQFLVWNDPLGGGGEILVFLQQVVRKHSGNHELLPIWCDISADARYLANALRAWVRLLNGLVEPNVYPAMPIWVAPGVDHRLWADPFWRALHCVLLRMQMKESEAYASSYPQWVAQDVNKVNRLARDTGLGSRFVFSWKHGELLMYDPDGGPAQTIDPNPLNRLADAHGPAGARAIECIEKWKERRAAMLIPTPATEVASVGRGATGSTSEKGRKESKALRDGPGSWREVEAKGKPLRGWAQIMTAIGTTNTRAAQVELKRHNKRSDGPIQLVRSRPEADAGQLSAWIKDAKGRADAAATERRNAAQAITLIGEREGVALADHNLHAEKRPNARGKARPASSHENLRT